MQFLLRRYVLFVHPFFPEDVGSSSTQTQCPIVWYDIDGHGGCSSEGTCGLIRENPYTGLVRYEAPRAASVAETMKKDRGVIVVYLPVGSKAKSNNDLKSIDEKAKSMAWTYAKINAKAFAHEVWHTHSSKH